MTDTFSYRPRGIFNLCVRYLLTAGWVRDGDDPGIWIRPAKNVFITDSFDFGWALVKQLEADGVSLLEVPAE